MLNGTERGFDIPDNADQQHAWREAQYALEERGFRIQAELMGEPDDLRAWGRSPYQRKEEDRGPA